MSTHHKFSIFYYILLDFDRTSGRDNVSDAFVDASGMPKKYQIFMKGLWYLDHRDFSVSFQLRPCWPVQRLTSSYRERWSTSRTLLLYPTLQMISSPSSFALLRTTITALLYRTSMPCSLYSRRLLLSSFSSMPWRTQISLRLCFTPEHTLPTPGRCSSVN